MGEGPDSTTGDGPVTRAEHEVESLRGEIGDLVAELDRRRHEATDLGLQIRRHPLAAAAVVTIAAIFAGGLLASAVRARRRRLRRFERARALQKALGHIARHPEELSRNPGTAERLFVSVLTAGATTLAMRFVERAVAEAPQHA